MHINICMYPYTCIYNNIQIGAVRLIWWNVDNIESHWFLCVTWWNLKITTIQKTQKRFAVIDMLSYFNLPHRSVRCHGYTMYSLLNMQKITSPSFCFKRHLWKLKSYNLIMILVASTFNFSYSFHYNFNL